MTSDERERLATLIQAYRETRTLYRDPPTVDAMRLRMELWKRVDELKEELRKGPIKIDGKILLNTGGPNDGWLEIDLWTVRDLDEVQVEASNYSPVPKTLSADLNEKLYQRTKKFLPKIDGYPSWEDLSKAEILAWAEIAAEMESELNDCKADRLASDEEFRQSRLVT